MAVPSGHSFFIRSPMAGTNSRAFKRPKKLDSLSWDQILCHILQPCTAVTVAYREEPINSIGSLMVTETDSIIKGTARPGPLEISFLPTKGINAFQKQPIALYNDSDLTKSGPGAVIVS